MNIIQKQYNRIATAIKTWLTNRANAKLLASFMADIPESEIPFFKSVLEMGLSYNSSAQRAMCNPRIPNKMILGVTKHAMKKLLILRNIIGIQPISGPVGLLFSLQYTGEAATSETTASTLRLEIISKAITASSRKIQAGWTMEAAQDMKVQHGIDIESEIYAALGDEVANEVVRTVLEDLYNLAATKDPIVVPTTKAIYDDAVKLTLGINKAAINIAKDTRRGMGNFIITTPLGLCKLQIPVSNTQKFVSVPKSDSYQDLTHSGNLVHIDTDGKETVMYKVFSTLCMPGVNDTCPYLVGYKGGSGEYDTGYFYSPFVLVMNGGMQVDPMTFQPIVVLHTRATHTALDTAKNYYALVTHNFLSSTEPSQEEETTVSPT